MDRSPNHAMPLNQSRGVTTLLLNWQEGDPAAKDLLVPAVYSELRRIAKRLMRRERQGHTFDPTDLVDESFTKLFGKPILCKNSGEFFGIAATRMHHVLGDYVRKKLSAMHGGNLERALDDWNNVT